MKIHEILSTHRRDFVANMVCEQCGHTHRLSTGYDDANYHENIIPAMHCPECGMNRAGEMKPLPEEPQTAEAAAEPIEAQIMAAAIVKDPHFHEKHWRCSRVIIGPVENNQRATGWLVEPFRFCRIVTENGQFWGVSLSTFSLTEDRVRELWDQKPSAFVRINMKEAK